MASNDATLEIRFCLDLGFKSLILSSRVPDPDGWGEGGVVRVRSIPFDRMHKLSDKDYVEGLARHLAGVDAACLSDQVNSVTFTQLENVGIGIVPRVDFDRLENALLQLLDCSAPEPA